MVEIFKKWIAALRSGKYKQTQFHMKKDGCFCALGVLCEITDPNGWHQTEKGEYWYPDPPIPCGHRVWGQSFVWNDSERLSFVEIANELEKRYVEGH